jgi:hypothetical protein
MTDLAVIEHTDTLPAMVQQAAQRLSSATTAAEVLEARVLATAAYDAGESALRLAKLRRAHDDVISAVLHTQADALKIEFTAKRRLAEEYDAAKARGEVRGEGQPRTAAAGNSTPTTADLGLSRKEISEGREIAAAEAANPGVIERSLASQLFTGQQPTRAETRRAFRETVHGIGQRPTERTVTTIDTTLVAILDTCRKLEAQIEKAGIERLADAIPDSDPRLAAVPVIQALRDRLNEWLEAL